MSLDFVFGFGLALVVIGLVAALLLAQARYHDLERVNASLRERIANLERVDRNPLYRESMEDQRARELKAADAVSVGVEHMLNAIRILAPEMLKKGKK
jgi:uncharacterized membrane protein YccC